MREATDVSADYMARVGRDALNFQYVHTSPNNRRVDPSPNNLMDIFILTKQPHFYMQL